MLNDSYEPAKTVNGKPSFEAEMLWDTFRFCKQQLAGGQLDDAERKALEFYVEQMRDIHPCADENKFKKPGRGIGGTGDSEIIKPYVVRDHQTNKPLLRHDGSPLTIKCRFRDVVRYLYTIKSQKSESLNMIDGVRALSVTDQLRYQKPDPYAYAYRSITKDSFSK
ncbi:MAG: hypothetical protein IJ482_04500 [Alphaproteobacteria bacterium]|nr:hypothetical protein [Alphaproteobacteria bacterium]